MLRNLFHRRRPPAPAVVTEPAPVAAPVAPAAPSPPLAPVTVALIRAVRDEQKDATDVRTFALAVLDHMRRAPYDAFYTHDEVNAWARDFAAVSGVDIDGLDLNRVRGIIKAQTEHVGYFEKRIRADDQFADLRVRLRRTRGQIPQKCWLFHIKTTLGADHDTSETVAAGLLPSGGGAAATATTGGGRSRPESTPAGFQDGGRSRPGVETVSPEFVDLAPTPPRRTAYG